MSEHSLLERIAEVVQLNANAKQVYGEPVERDGVTIIPVAKVHWGFGGGGIGRGIAERGGGGGGVRSVPVGYIYLKNGAAEFRPIDDSRTITHLLAAGAAGIILGLLAGKLSR